MTEDELAAFSQGVAQFVTAAEQSAPDLAIEQFASLADGAGRERFVQLFGELAATEFVESSQSLLAFDGEDTEAVLHGGGGANLGRHILRAFRNRLCGNTQISDQLREELKKLERYRKAYLPDCSSA